MDNEGACHLETAVLGTLSRGITYQDVEIGYWGVATLAPQKVVGVDQRGPGGRSTAEVLQYESGRESITLLF